MLLTRLEHTNLADSLFNKEIHKIDDELQILMTSQNKTNRLLYQILYQYSQKGYKIQGKKRYF